MSFLCQGRVQPTMFCGGHLRAHMSWTRSYRNAGSLNGLLVTILVLGKVGVANFVKRIPHPCICRRIQGPFICETFYQVRIADERSAKGNQVCTVALNGSFRLILGVTTVPHEWTFEHVSEFCQRHRASRVRESQIRGRLPHEGRQVRTGQAASATYRKVSRKSGEPMSLKLPFGETCTPTLPDGQTVRIALTVSSKNRKRFSRLPP